MSSASFKHIDLPNKSHNGEVQLLFFSLLPEEEVKSSSVPHSCFAINIFKIKEVLKSCTWIHTPNLQQHFSGLISVRGTWLPVVDINYLIAKKSVSTDLLDDSPVILIEYDRKLYGFLVGHIYGIDFSEWGNIHSLSELVTYKNKSFMTGIGHSRSFGHFMMLDVEKIITDIHDGAKEEEGLAQILSDGHKKYLGKKIFIADDSFVIRKSMSKNLEPLGVSIEFFENGKDLLEALFSLKKEAAYSKKPITEYVNLVVSDIEMPEMDGISLIKKIKNDPVLSTIKTILYSYLSIHTSSRIGLDVGADDVLQKLDTVTLITRIRKFLDPFVDSSQEERN